jgi:hypothetical protein
VLVKTLTLATVLVVLAIHTPNATACPVCNTNTGQQVRAGIFDQDFARNLLATLLPFPLLFGAVAAIHYGWPRSRPRHSRPQQGAPHDNP